MAKGKKGATAVAETSHVFGEPVSGWAAKEPTRLYSDSMHEKMAGLIDEWLKADDARAGEIEAELTESGLARTADADTERAEVRFDVVHGERWELYVGDEGTLAGYYAESTLLARKTPVRATVALVEEEVRRVEAELAGKGNLLADPPAAPTSAATTPAPAAPASASAPTAGGDDHANAALAEQKAKQRQEDQVVIDHTTLKARVSMLEARVQAAPDGPIAHIVHELEREVKDICTATWLKDDVNMAGIVGLRATVREKNAMVARLRGTADLEDARKELSAFEEQNKLFLAGRTKPKPPASKDPTAPGADGPAKTETKAKADAAKAQLAAEAEAPSAPAAAEKPKSDATKSLEALLSAPQPLVYSGPPLGEETRAKVTALGLAWTGKVVAHAPSEGTLRDVLVGLEIARAKQMAKREADLLEQLAGYGWSPTPAGK